MRRLSISIGVVLLSSVSAFSPNSWDGRISSALTSTLSENNDVMVDTTVVGVEQETHLLVANVEVPAVPLPNVALPSTDSEKKKNSMEEINKKDKTSMDLSKKNNLDIVFEDEHIVVVNKPCGILSAASGKSDIIPSLNQVVFDAVGCETGRMDTMVLHRLGINTSGLLVFAKTSDANRGMSALFRTRNVYRQYEALVAGHVETDKGFIDLLS